MAQENPVYDQIAPLYDTTRGWPREVEQQIGIGLYKLLAEATNTDQPKVLEVGIGTGRAAAPLAEQGVIVFGADISGVMMTLAVEKAQSLASAGLPHQLYAVGADAHHLPFPNACFDAGLLIHILHLIGDWKAGLDELRRTLRPNDIIVLGYDKRDKDAASWTDIRWREIITEQGYQLEGEKNERIATTFASVDYLHSKGYSSNAHILAEWTRTRTPAQILSQFLDKSFMRETRDIPDDLMGFTAQQLEAELLAQFGNLDIELESQQRFTVLLAQRKQENESGD